MYNALCKLLSGDEFSVIESFEIPEQSARFSATPRFLFNSRVGLCLDQQLSDSGGIRLWAHQSQSLEALGRGENVVVSTGTASGKSLVFRSLVFHKIFLDLSCRALVFYPLKALAADQLRGWKRMARLLELDENLIGRIDGSVPVRSREKVLQDARIVVMTPDVCHAWLMSQLSLPAVKSFVRSLSTLVMDEAHTLEGVFGSNFSFLIRRLIATRNYLVKEPAPCPLQLVAATATIANPGEHMKQLTGSDFSVIDHSADGAPQHGRIVAHIACPEGDEVRVIKELHDRVLADGSDGGFITFLDSRKGVEGLAMATRAESNNDDVGGLLADTDVLPYRAGYDAGDRQQIEQRLRSGKLRGVVSTSALELGIDIPHLRVGFNVGVPGTRKAYRQRLGRVGRSGPGAFVVVAPQHAFRRYGTTFREYHEMSVEPSYLYLDNRFMQFAHGRCLAIELEALGAPSKIPARIDWPKGFQDVYPATLPGGHRPPEFDAIAALGGDTPHYGYPLRNVGEVNFQIKTRSDADSIGDVSQLQALRECYPGATYLHLARAYEVAAWHTISFEPFIRVKHGAWGRPTRPRIITWINTGLTHADLLENHALVGESGFLAECQMQITERVEGYVDGSTGGFHSYQDLQELNPNMRARSRNFRTSGFVLCINRDWFKETSVKRTFADRLREVFVREYSVSPQDVGSAASNISVRSPDGGGLRGGCVAVFDETYGSLRLTERLYLEFDHVLARLSTAVAESKTDGDGFESIVARIRHELETFTDTEMSSPAGTAPPKGHERVFTKGSRVCYRQGGQMAVDVEVIQPTLMDGRLMYQVKVLQKRGHQPVRQWIAESAIEPSGDASAWDYAWWNRETEAYEEPPEEASAESEI